MLYFLQFNAAPGKFSENAENILKHASDVKKKGALALVVSAFALEGVPSGSYLRYAGVQSAYEDAKRMLEQAEVPVLLMNADNSATLYSKEGQSVHAMGDVFSLAAEQVLLGESKKDEDEESVPYTVRLVALTHTFDRSSPLSFKHPLIQEGETQAALYLNCVGFSDERVFEGGSLVMAEDNLRFQVRRFETALAPISGINVVTEKESEAAALWHRASVFAIRDFFHKNGKSKAILGLSGGIDSALSACLATIALGKENITTYMLQSEFTSQESIDAAASLAKALGVAHHHVDLRTPIAAFAQTVEGAHAYHARSEDVRNLTNENLQARSRMLYLMAEANLSDALLVGSSNKSEILSGYGTLYGDMAGAFNPLKDFYKLEVYQIAQYASEQLSDAISDFIFERPPSAELSKDQTDEDSLPSYEVFDALMQAHLLQFQDAATLAQRFSMEESEVVSLIRRVRQNTFKLSQLAPGFVSSSHSVLSEDWQYPSLWQGPIY